MMPSKCPPLLLLVAVFTLYSPIDSTLAFTSTASSATAKARRASLGRPYTSSGTSTVSTTTKTTTQLSAFGLSSLDTFFQTDPYLAAFLTCSIKASAADMVAQVTSHKKSHHDVISDDTKNHHHHHDGGDDDITTATTISSSSSPSLSFTRNLAFILYGGLYQGCVQTFIFTCLFPHWFPDHTAQSVLSQVAIDLLILGPMVCMPTVYTMKALLQHTEEQQQQQQQETSSNFRWTQGLETYFDHIQTKGILTKYWSIWAPVQTLNFGVVPPHLRVVFVAMVSFFWICLLSTTVNSDNEEKEITTTSADAAIRQQQQQQQPTWSPSPPYPQHSHLHPHQPIAIPVLVNSFVGERQQRQHAHSHP